ncbi:unnamed protein product [Protopolystoma xenopodis]|uniref:Uncharacterized protein n=1 Tax=Protopolystoma xenopodis TaxID=117903 RepID=A0A3S5APE9_9PLAT|nr:unnamed protein product [Protopolystoma xenopodis]
MVRIRAGLVHDLELGRCRLLDAVFQPVATGCHNPVSHSDSLSDSYSTHTNLTGELNKRTSHAVTCLISWMEASSQRLLKESIGTGCATTSNSASTSSSRHGISISSLNEAEGLLAEWMSWTEQAASRHTLLAELVHRWGLHWRQQVPSTTTIQLTSCPTSESTFSPRIDSSLSPITPIEGSLSARPVSLGSNFVNFTKSAYASDRRLRKRKRMLREEQKQWTKGARLDGLLDRWRAALYHGGRICRQLQDMVRQWSVLELQRLPELQTASELLDLLIADLRDPEASNNLEEDGENVKSHRDLLIYKIHQSEYLINDASEILSRVENLTEETTILSSSACRFTFELFPSSFRQSSIEFIQIEPKKLLECLASLNVSLTGQMESLNEFMKSSRLSFELEAWRLYDEVESRFIHLSAKIDTLFSIPTEVLLPEMPRGFAPKEQNHILDNPTLTPYKLPLIQLSTHLADFDAELRELSDKLKDVTEAITNNRDFIREVESNKLGLQCLNENIQKTSMQINQMAIQMQNRLDNIFSMLKDLDLFEGLFIASKHCLDGLTKDASILINKCMCYFAREADTTTTSTYPESSPLLINISQLEEIISAISMLTSNSGPLGQMKTMSGCCPSAPWQTNFTHHLQKVANSLLGEVRGLCDQLMLRRTQLTQLDWLTGLAEDWLTKQAIENIYHFESGPERYLAKVHNFLRSDLGASQIDCFLALNDLVISFGSGCNCEETETLVRARQALLKWRHQTVAIVRLVDVYTGDYCRLITCGEDFGISKLIEMLKSFIAEDDDMLRGQSITEESINLREPEADESGVGLIKRKTYRKLFYFQLLLVKWRFRLPLLAGILRSLHTALLWAEGQNAPDGSSASRSDSSTILELTYALHSLAYRISQLASKASRSARVLEAEAAIRSELRRLSCRWRLIEQSLWRRQTTTEQKDAGKTSSGEIDLRISLICTSLRNESSHLYITYFRL